MEKTASELTLVEPARTGIVVQFLSPAPRFPMIYVMESTWDSSQTYLPYVQVAIRYVQWLTDFLVAMCDADISVIEIVYCVLQVARQHTSNFGELQLMSEVSSQ